MLRTLLTSLATVAGFVVALAGVLLLVWLLWRLWARGDEEEEATAIEIELETSPEAEEEAPAKEIETVAPPEPEAEAPAEPQAEVPVEEVEVEAEAPEEPSAPPEPDDLKRIEGIGPKISSVLQEAGITTFAQLADTEVSHIEQILEAADPRLLRLARPTTWPEQASLAAAGEWEALEALQDSLKGGQRA